MTDDIPVALQVNTCASNTNLELSGIHLTDLSVDAGVGDIKVDLSGAWEVRFDASIKTGVGETVIILPKDVGVKLVANKGIGSSNFDGLVVSGERVYVNEAYEEADIIINVQVEIGVGEAKFVVEDKIRDLLPT